jgi:Tol biopolymer transport system component
MRIIDHTDDTTGVRVWQLGEDPHFTNHFYTDNPSFSADSKQFIFMTGPDHCVDCQVLLCDIPTRTVRPVSELRGALAGVMSPTRPEVYFCVLRDGVVTLYRTQLATGETGEVARVPNVTSMYSLGAIDPRGERYATGVTRPDGVSAVVEVDLSTGSVDTITESADVYNPHPNYSPDGNWLIVQINYADRWIDNRSVPITDPPGLKTRVKAWDRARRTMQEMPFAPGRDADIQGHQCWAGGNLMLATIISHVHGRWQGSIWSARPGDTEARCITDALDWRHPSATLDGATIACDEWDDRDVYLIDTASGRHELLCRTGAIDWDKLRGVPAYSLQQWHPHPTISPDGRSVLFNSNRTGTAHAYVAFR